MQLRLIILFFILLTLATPAMAKSIRIVIAPLAPAESPKILATAYLKKLIEERSTNRIEVTIENSSHLNTQQVLDSLNVQKFHLALLEVDDIATVFPMLEVYDLPFLFKDRQHFHRILDNEVGEAISQTPSDQNMKILSIWDGTMRQLLTQRTTSTSTLDSGSFFTKSQPGSSDDGKNWVEFDLTNVSELSNQNGLGTLVLTNHSISASALLTHRSFWNQLPEDLRVIITGAIKDASAYIRELAEQADKEALLQLKNIEHTKTVPFSKEQRTFWQKKALETIRKNKGQDKLSIIKRIMMN